TDGADETPTIERIRACALGEIGSPREREEAIATLDRLVADGGPEAPQAAIYRLGHVTARQPAAWSEQAAEVLRREDYVAPADVARAFLLDQVEGNAADATRLLDEHGDEMWALLAKLRLAGMRGDEAAMAEAAGAL